MANISSSVTELVGNTPLLQLRNCMETDHLTANVLAKLEYLNPAGSVKDRIAVSMLDAAEERGWLKPGGTIIEATSGSIGVSLAAVAAVRKYRLIITMPSSMYPERVKLLKAYGAKVVLVSGGMKNAVAKAKQLAAGIPGSFIPRQFENPDNPAIHRTTTGPEIWKATDGKIDIFVAGVGTGGTITGVGEYLKSKNPRIKIVAVEPQASPVLSHGKAGQHKIQGIGAGFVPEILNTRIYDEVYRVPNQDAFAAAGFVAQQEGILVGVSSGAALSAAFGLAKRVRNSGKTIVTLLPDGGDRYCSTLLEET